MSNLFEDNEIIFSSRYELDKHKNMENVIKIKMFVMYIFNFLSTKRNKQNNQMFKQTSSCY